jgi:hypothetical protein
MIHTWCNPPEDNAKRRFGYKRIWKYEKERISVINTLKSSKFESYHTCLNQTKNQTLRIRVNLNLSKLLNNILMFYLAIDYRIFNITLVNIKYSMILKYLLKFFQGCTIKYLKSTGKSAVIKKIKK